MNRLLTILLTAALFLGPIGAAVAANSDNHTVTLHIVAINHLAITGRNITFNSATSAQATATKTRAVTYTLTDS